MSIENRDVTTAFAVVVCFGLMWGLGVWYGAYNEARRADLEESEARPYQGTLDAKSFWKEHGGSSESYAALCRGPIDDSQADLCQQWRSANAAQEMAGYTLASVLFGFVGLIGVGFTVYLSNKATTAATEATRAAIRSADAAEQAYVAANRPWLTIEPVVVGPISVLDGKIQSTVSVKITNISNAPSVAVASNWDVFATRNLVAGNVELDRLIYSEISKAMRENDRTILLPGESILHNFTSSSYKSIILPHIVIPEGPVNTISFALVVFYRSVVSQEWFYSAVAFAALPKDDGVDFGQAGISFAAEELRAAYQQRLAK